MRSSRLFLSFEPLKYKYTGLGQVCWHLGKALERKMPAEWQVEVGVPKKDFYQFGSRFNYLNIESKIRKAWARRKSFDVWHVLHQRAKFLPANAHTRFVLTIQDLNFLSEIKEISARQEFQDKLSKKISRAQFITCASNYTAKQVRQNFDIDANRIETIYNGVDINLDLLPERPKALVHDKFIFTLCAISPKKNTHVLIDMLPKLPDVNLVMAGYITHSKDQAYVHHILRRAKELGVEKRVQFLGCLSEAEKYWLYQHARAFVFPSLLEGFGLPVIEAMRFGCPVFLSKYTCLPEIGGIEAYYWENFDADHMAEKFEAGLSAFHRDIHKSQRIQNWASQFSWDSAAEKYIQLYQRL